MVLGTVHAALAWLVIDETSDACTDHRVRVVNFELRGHELAMQALDEGLLGKHGQLPWLYGVEMRLRGPGARMPGAHLRSPSCLEIESPALEPHSMSE